MSGWFVHVFMSCPGTFYGDPHNNCVGREYAESTTIMYVNDFIYRGEGGSCVAILVFLHVHLLGQFLSLQLHKWFLQHLVSCPSQLHPKPPLTHVLRQRWRPPVQTLCLDSSPPVPAGAGCSWQCTAGWKGSSPVCRLRANGYEQEDLCKGDKLISLGFFGGIFGDYALLGAFFSR